MTMIRRVAIALFLLATGSLIPVSAQAGDDYDDLYGGAGITPDLVIIAIIP
jgi:hypothetical protein